MENQIKLNVNSRLCLIWLIAIGLVPHLLFSQEESLRDSWIDSIMQQLTPEEKIGQLFMIRAFSRDDKAHIQQVREQIKKYKVGGVCFFQGDPARQLDLIKEYQKISQLPLFSSIDAEWGLGMRFPDKAISFPRQITIGAINDHQLIYRMGKEIARQMRLTGLNVNFAPAVDVNNNPDNPVINFRSFGEDRYNVSSKAFAYMYGMMEADVMPCAKHFPGHGDTNVDSHYDLPVISHDRRRLDSLELFPFKMMIDYGIPSIMVAHLQIPALESRSNRPTTVSHPVVSDLLRNELNFKGLIMTDAMEMKGVTKHFGPGEADLEAFLAGNDMILLPENMERAFSSLLAAYKSGIISDSRLDESVRRILGAKYDFKLWEKIPETVPDLSKELNSREARMIKSRIYEKALTLVSNKQKILPLKTLGNQKYASLSVGLKSKSDFQRRLDSYIDCEHFFLDHDASESEFNHMIETLSGYSIVFVSLHNMSWYSSKEFGLSSLERSFVETISRKNKVLLTIFGSPYSLKYFENVPNVLVAYEDGEMPQEAAAQTIMGANDITGRLPVSCGTRYKAGDGIMLPGLGRMGFSIPEGVGMNSDTLDKIEDLVKEMIDEKAAPGCQILIAKNNKIVYLKAFGTKSYQASEPVNLSDIYDVASVTKVLATTVSLMKLQDEGLFNPYSPLASYIPEEDTTNKGSIVCEDILAHMSGLTGWIPFYKNTVNESQPSKLNPNYYRHIRSDSFNIEVTQDLFLRSDYRDTIWRAIFSSELRRNNNYRYSDLGFYMFNRVIKKLTGIEVDLYALSNFYQPMGLRRTLFNPLRRINPEEIAPSEDDDYFRMGILRGTVHDMGAAMLGGVSGHAGLFSNAFELGSMMQMLLNKGYYGGRQYLSSNIVEKYTKRHWRSTRRGLGFDLKEMDASKSLNMCEEASPWTFGHLGFTGTSVFADPENDIVFVMLTNRTYPSMNNNKFGLHDYRPRIQSVAYRSLINAEVLP